MTSSTLGFDTKIILLHLLALRYFAVIFFHLLLPIEVFPHQNNPIFYTKHHRPSCCSSLQPLLTLDFSLLIEQHLTHLYLPATELRTTSTLQ